MMKLVNAHQALNAVPNTTKSQKVVATIAMNKPCGSCVDHLVLCLPSVKNDYAPCSQGDDALLNPDNA